MSALLAVVICSHPDLELSTVRDLTHQYIMDLSILLSVFLLNWGHTTLSPLILLDFSEVLAVLKKRNNESDSEVKGDPCISCTCSLFDFVSWHWNVEMKVFFFSRHRQISDSHPLHISLGHATSVIDQHACVQLIWSRDFFLFFFVKTEGEQIDWHLLKGP